MIRHLQLTLDNGKTGDKAEKLYIFATEGFEFYSIHLSLECSKFGIDTTDTDGNVTMGVDEPTWWKTTIEFLLGVMCASALISLPDWIKLTPEMFGEDKWTALAYSGRVPRCS